MEINQNKKESDGCYQNSIEKREDKSFGFLIHGYFLRIFASLLLCNHKGF